jgi:GlpG protein
MPEQELQALVGLEHHNIALLFCNYLRSIDIAASIDKSEGQFVIYCHKDKYAQAQGEFTQFIANPADQKYQQAAWTNGNVSPVSSDQPSIINDFNRQFLAHAGWFTLTIFAVCWLIFFASLAGWSNAIFHQLQFYPVLSVEQLSAEPWRILGPALFHFSWLHIVFNSMWWWQLGGSIERIMGTKSLILLFLISAIFSNVGQYIMSGPNFGGLSGVVYGVVGYVWWAGWLAPKRGLHLSKAIIGFLLFWLLLGYVDILPVKVANTAHLLGLVSGCLLAWLTFSGEKNNSVNG